jgi:PAS domain S-box-containing protein
MLEEITTPQGIRPIDKEVFWDKTQTIISKSDLFGTIDYANETFADVSGYEEYELMGKPHNAVRHPDMPKIIFKMLWDALKKEEPFHVIAKNLAKSGRYYWVISDFEYIRDDQGKVINYLSRRDSIPQEVLDNHIIPLYRKLLLIEQASGLKYSEKYLIGFLEEKKVSFSDYITGIMVDYIKKHDSVMKIGKIEVIKNPLAEINQTENFGNNITLKNHNTYETIEKEDEEVLEERSGFFARFFGKRN